MLKAADTCWTRWDHWHLLVSNLAKKSLSEEMPRALLQNRRQGNAKHYYMASEPHDVLNDSFTGQYEHIDPGVHRTSTSSKVRGLKR